MRQQGRLRQFAHGMSLPFHIARALLADSAARSRYLRVGMMQTLVALALSLTCMGSAKKAANAVDERRDAAVEAEVSRVIQAAAHAMAEDKAKDVDPEVMERLRERRRRRIAARERAKQEAAAGPQAGDEASAPRGTAGGTAGTAVAGTEAAEQGDGEESEEEQATAPGDEEGAAEQEQASGTPAPTHFAKKPGSTPPAGTSETASAEQSAKAGDQTRTSERQEPGSESKAKTSEKLAAAAQRAERRDARTASENPGQTPEKLAAATQPSEPTDERSASEDEAADAQAPAATRRAETAIPGKPPTGSDAIEDDTLKAPESTEAVLDDVDSLPPDVRESLKAASAAMKQAVEAEAARDKALEQRVRDVEAAASGQSDGGPSLASALGALIADAVTTELKQSAAEEQADGGIAGAPSSSKPQEKVEPPPQEEEDALPFLSYKGFSLLSLPFWIALFAAMQLAQWVIIALSRDYHDVISRDASLLTRIEPEDEAFTPHVRLNVQWLRKKVQRRVRAMLLFAVGVPAAVFVVSPLFCTGLSGPLITAITSLWGMWWLMVFTAAKSCRAWDEVEGRRPPWFLRAWTTLTTRVPGLRWGILQRYGAMWTQRTSEVYAPVASVERHPWAYAGLSLVRFVGSFAPLKFFVRPLIPVASAHILQHERTRRLTHTSPDQDHPAKDS
ncbi:hypothetical protein SAMN05443572_108159 [Myxococcus fulvus]|uniref:Lipoprotein n=1 Tax=Myxococcus fulvus TaxID=33 RepID=A0ABY1CPI3_MYXFU|nr:hypothetical protein [Myxococcus fulvus]SEU29295.1 hypothetical protein SAMN05443572_108159 [Myxococcus fulvus]